jgi:uncharacterized protein YciI
MSVLRFPAVLVTLLLLTISGLRAEDSKKPLIDPNEMTNYWWINLVSGDNKTALSQEDGMRMQQEHIGNLERMGKEGKCLAAGPFGDGTRLRGIAVMTVKSRADVDAEFKSDPFVKNGYLKVEAAQWYTFKNSFGKAEEPFKLGKYRLVFFNKGPKYTDENTPEKQAAINGHLAHLIQARKEGLLALAGPLRDAGDRMGVMVFRTDDDARVRAFVDADPLVKSGQGVPEAHPLFLGKGVLDPR